MRLKHEVKKLLRDMAKKKLAIEQYQNKYKKGNALSNK